MSILVLNPGSTSIKFKFFDNSLQNVASGGIFKEGEKVILKQNENESELTQTDFENSYEIIKKIAPFQPEKVGYRLVHGGENFIQPTLLNPEVISELEKISELAPLHNPPAIKIIKQYLEHFPESKHFAVFDTAFHSSIPEKAFIYGLPYEYYENYKIRKYGFHGISYSYVASELSKLEPEAKKVIICHIGGGVSVAAVQDGKSVDTSMGFTPLEGALMATRSGDLDDGVTAFLHRKLNLSLDEILEIENKKSGLLGISGITENMKELVELESQGNKRAKLAIDVFIYRLQKIIGSFASSLNGVDALVFTAGIGAGSDLIRKKVVESLTYLGFELDETANNQRNVTTNLKISTTKPSIWVIPTNEEFEIAKQVNSI